MPKPSPWDKKAESNDQPKARHWPPSSGPVDEEYMFTRGQLATNSLPFIKRLSEVLDEAEVNSLKLLTPQSHSEAYWKAKSLLWMLNAQFYGELAVIDLPKEWSELTEALKADKF